MFLVKQWREFHFGREPCWNYFFVATAVMFLGGLFALMIKLLPWLLLAVAVVWVIKTIKAPKVPQYQRNNRRFY